MLLDNYKKESPIIGVAGMGGGINSYIFLSSDGGYVISRSLRFNSGDSAYLSRTPSSASNRKTWTWSGWVKRSALSGSTRDWIFIGGNTASDTGIIFIGFKQNDDLLVGTNNTDLLLTDAVFRDLSAWMHIVVAFDTTQSTASDRLKVYVNGVEITSFSTDNRSSITQNGDYGANQAQRHTIGSVQNYGGNTPEYIDAYLADIHFIDGQALAPTDFGETDSNGVWQPKLFAGTYGTNGFHLDFSDNSSNAALGTDTSSNGNTWTVNNLSVAAGAGNDSLRDTPSNAADPTDSGIGGEVVGNYCTLNPLKKANITTSNGNLDFTHSGSTGNWQVVFSTIGMSSGKYYCEFTCKDSDSVIGIAKDSHTIANDKYVGNDPNGWGYNGQNGSKINNSSGSSYGSSYTSGDIIGIAFDADGGNLYFYKNGAVQNSGTAAYTGLTDGPYFFAFSLRDTGNTPSVNFGQRAFAYQNAGTNRPSADYKSLNTANLPTPTIADGSQYFEAKKYDGNGGTQTISNLSFSPDFTWLKKRSGSADHYLYDQVRGATYRLYSNTTDAESTSSTGLTAFTSDGFSLGNANDVNQSSNTYISWNWDAGTSTVTNNDGSIASQVRANPSAGFSIVTYTGSSSVSTVGHGLNSAPGMYVVKRRTDAGYGWIVYHSAMGASNMMALQNTSGAALDFDPWNQTAPTSSVFTVNTTGSGTVNAASKDYVAYCFAPVEGYSAMGSVNTNGTTDNAFIYLGFRAKFVMFKRTDSTGNWTMWDTSRNTYNVMDKYLFANTSGSEGTDAQFDILSNGIKLRTAGYASGATFIYLAVAENPFQANGGLAR